MKSGYPNRPPIELLRITGARRRERRLSISWCFSSRDSVTTERAPPGRASLARVTNRWTTRRSKSRIVEPSDQGYRSAQVCSHAGSHAMIGEFAPQRCPYRDHPAGITATSLTDTTSMVYSFIWFSSKRRFSQLMFVRYSAMTITQRCSNISSFSPMPGRSLLVPVVCVKYDGRLREEASGEEHESSITTSSRRPKFG